jgi:hypothetical protein
MTIQSMQARLKAHNEDNEYLETIIDTIEILQDEMRTDLEDLDNELIVSMFRDLEKFDADNLNNPSFYPEIIHSIEFEIAQIKVHFLQMVR